MSRNNQLKQISLILFHFKPNQLLGQAYHTTLNGLLLKRVTLFHSTEQISYEDVLLRHMMVYDKSSFTGLLCGMIILIYNLI